MTFWFTTEAQRTQRATEAALGWFTTECMEERGGPRRLALVGFGRLLGDAGTVMVGRGACGVASLNRVDVESMHVDDDDRMLLTDVLNVAKVDSSAIQSASLAAIGTTGRVHRFRLDGRMLVAKIADAPVTAERAAREVAVLSSLARDATGPLESLAPRFVAGRVDTDPTRPRTIVVTEWIDGHHDDPALGITSERLHDIAAAMRPAWSLTADDIRARGLDLPRWGIGTTATTNHTGDTPTAQQRTTATEPRTSSAHRRRADRFRRRADDLRRHHEDAAERFDRVLTELGNRYEAIAAAATTATSATDAKGANARPLRLIHGDLHLGNVLFTSAAGGGARAASHEDLSSRIRIIDWQTASLGDPVHDLARLAMESLQSPTFASIRAAATHLPEPTDDTTLARAILLAFAGFVVGLGGRDPSSLIAPDRALVTRLLADDVLADTLDRCLAVSTD
jgi:hypothetical protein